MRPGTSVFVDTGAWIALALQRDPLHERAANAWSSLNRNGTKFVTSIPIVLETFTFLDRNTRRDVALAWKDSLSSVPHLQTVECTTQDMSSAWQFFARKDFHKLSAVDATSFVIMKRTKTRYAFAFDHHFAQAGFRMV